MTGIVDSNVLVHGFGRHSNWQGRSGQTYGLLSENLERFAMNEAQLFVLAKGSHVMWVGSTDELVADPMSRTRFRLALDCADRVFRVLSAGNAERLATIWDLEGAEPLQGAQAA
ncbi:hypothetical protein SAMN05428969_2565 [Devosia sp. YR412]|uniref:hypothetical protein n=1 Tax=Devosia sp. YR412 TaxID=1881030 RepID=UPI0008C6C9B9|nr:hypothetical protein [Devosia sp. YR412]SEQ28783.1 hypothetical protein SAMN05428969_2565 [Devosia sp. YR412]